MIAPALRRLLACCLLTTACAGGDDDAADDVGASSTAATAGDASGTSAGDDVDPSLTGDTTPGDATSPMATSNTTGDDTTGDDTTTGVGGNPGQWLLTVDNGAAPPRLVRYDLDDGTSEAICAFPNGTVYSSIAFARDGTLYAHSAGQSRIDTINPCNCGFQIVGPTSTGALVLAIDADDGMFGIETTLDALVTVDLDNGLANPIGGIGIDLGGIGASWADAMTGLYVLDDTTDELYALDDATGLATATSAVSQDVTNPGLAVHPDGTFYVCDGGTVYELDTFTGMMTTVGSIDLDGACTNLTAPRTGIACLD